MIAVARIGGASRVRFAPAALARFARVWPCMGDVSGPLQFEFARNGDLVDVQGDADLDGAAVLALSHDAQRLAGLEPHGPSDLDW